MTLRCASPRAMSAAPTCSAARELQLRSASTSGGYVLQVFNNNASFLLEPVAEPAPHIESARWFQVEARYEAQSLQPTPRLARR